MRIYVFIFLLGLFLASCSSSIRFSSKSLNTVPKSKERQQENIGQKFTGIASYYSDKFNGKLTASGEVFDNSLLTAAHRSLNFGTLVKVTHQKNGKSIIVKINDRGPFIDERIIDLSKTAAEALGMVKTGTAEVEIEIVE